MILKILKNLIYLCVDITLLTASSWVGIKLLDPLPHCTPLRRDWSFFLKSHLPMCRFYTPRSNLMGRYHHHYLPPLYAPEGRYVPYFQFSICILNFFSYLWRQRQLYPLNWKEVKFMVLILHGSSVIVCHVTIVVNDLLFKTVFFTSAADVCLFFF